MTEIIRFTCPLPPKELRPNRRGNHWAGRYKAADAYSEAVYRAWGEDAMYRRDGRESVAALDGPGSTPWPSARVTYTWRYCGATPDLDNIAGALKVTQDTLCLAPRWHAGMKDERNRYYLGIIENDAAIEAVTFRREKVAHRSEEVVEIVIERME